MSVNPLLIPLVTKKITDCELSYEPESLTTNPMVVSALTLRNFCRELTYQEYDTFRWQIDDLNKPGICTDIAKTGHTKIHNTTFGQSGLNFRLKFTLSMEAAISGFNPSIHKDVRIFEVSDKRNVATRDFLNMVTYTKSADEWFKIFNNTMLSADFIRSLQRSSDLFYEHFNSSNFEKDNFVDCVRVVRQGRTPYFTSNKYYSLSFEKIHDKNLYA